MTIIYDKAKRKEYWDKNKDRINAERRESNKTREYMKKYNKRPEVIERVKWANLMRNFGITKQEYLFMMEKQLSKCTICKTELDMWRGTHVDHCHLTGKIRSILCRKCNLLIANANENIDILNSAIDYLNNY